MLHFVFALLTAIGVSHTPLLAQRGRRVPFAEVLVGYGPAPTGDALLLGAGLLFPMRAPFEVRLIGTRAARDSSSAIQLAALLQWKPSRRRAYPYLAGGLLWRRVALPTGPTQQVDAELGVLGVVGGEVQVGSPGLLRLFLEGHGLAANGYGVEVAGGLRLALGRAPQ
jgi:hypothetical protein